MKEIVRTTCNRDCPDACGILAHVEDGRITRLQGDPAHPVTRGFLCYRTDQFLARQYSPERLTTPLVRKNGALTPATWEEALDLCASRLRAIREESGAAAIFHYRSGGSLGLMKHVTDYFFARFGPVTVKRGDICSGAGDAAQLADFGDEDANDLDDLLNARAVILWGKNPHTSGPHLLPVLNELRRRGARLALIDPVAHRAKGLCELYVQPRPGGDAALALGVARVMFERGWMHPDASSWSDHLDEYRALVHSRSVEEWAREADVTPDEVRALAELYGSAKPAAILVGWGMQRRSNGAAIVRALDALGVVSGNVGVAGGGVSFYFKRRGAFDLSSLQGRKDSARTLREPLFGEEILAASDPPVRAVWVTAGNPVAMLPDSHTSVKAIETREFVVVVDSFVTDTARLATVVLPTTTLLEDDDLVGAYGHHYIGNVRPVTPPPAGVRTDYEIVQGLAARLGLGDDFREPARVWKQRLLGTLSLETLERGAVRNPAAPRVAFEGRRFNTPTGRASLLRDALAVPAVATGEFPLLLHALSVPESQSSQWSPAEPDEALDARVHPDSSGGAADGALVTLRSALGAMTVRVRHDATLRRDVVVVPKGGTLGKNRCANAITRAVLSDAGEGAALYEEPVRIEA